ncbi:hypothetical protein FACS1894110_20910 [Spirochaetia bacterium]|nr:hypothetical protein FACS1894110_20910 [Spirochaetia bacterium]
MNNVIFKKITNQKYFNYKPLPLPGAYMPIKSSLPGYLFRADIFYKFNDKNYVTIENRAEKIRKLFVLIVSRDECAIGLEYEHKIAHAPILSIKEEKNITALIQLCKENNIVVAYNKNICRQIFKTTDIGDTIPGIFWENIATIFVKAIKSRSTKNDILFINKKECIVGIKWNKNMKGILIKHSLKNNSLTNIVDLDTCEKKGIPVIYDEYLADYLYNFITDKFEDLPVIIQKNIWELAAVLMAKILKNNDDLYTPTAPQVPLSLEIGKDLVPLIEKKKGAKLLEQINRINRESRLELGLVIPWIQILDNTQLKPSEYCIKIKGVEVGRGTIKLGWYLCINPGTVTTEIDGEKTKDPAFGLPALWISEENKEPARSAGYTVVETLAIIATHLRDIIKHYAAEFLGRQETQDILDALKKSCPVLVAEVQKVLSLGDIRKVLQALLREQVSIRNMTDILEALADHGQAATANGLQFLIEKVRQALGRQICMQYADEDRVLRVLTLSIDLELKILDSSVETASGIISAMDPPTQTAWIKALSRSVAAVQDQRQYPIILCSEAARLLVKSSTERALPDLVVLSVPEIAKDITVEAVGEIAIDSDKELE